MKQRITTAQWEEIENQSNAASYFLKDKQFAFIRHYLEDAIAEITSLLLNNKIKTVTEELTVSDKLKKLFVTPKKVQEDELSGQYKIINQFLSWLEYTSKLKTDLEAKEAKKQLIIERSKEV